CAPACRWLQWSAACCRRSTKERGSPPATQDGQPGRRLASTSWCPSLSPATAISPPRLRAVDQQRSACTAHPVLWTPALAATGPPRVRERRCRWRVGHCAGCPTLRAGSPERSGPAHRQLLVSLTRVYLKPAAARRDDTEGEAAVRLDAEAPRRSQQRTANKTRC